MRLYTNCINCKTEINFRITASDRFVLAKKQGERIKLNCKSCGTTKEYHVNDLKAEESRVVGIISVLIFLGGTTVLLIYLWPYIFQISSVYAISGAVGILTIPFIVYQTINLGQVNRVKYFNAKRYG